MKKKVYAAYLGEKVVKFQNGRDPVLYGVTEANFPMILPYDSKLQAFRSLKPKKCFNLISYVNARPNFHVSMQLMKDLLNSL